MRSKWNFLSVLLALAVIIGAQSASRAQDRMPKATPSPSPSPSAATPEPSASNDDQDAVRGAFLTSRPKTADKPKSTTTGTPVRKPRRRPAGTTNPSTSGTSSSNTTTTTTQTTGSTSRKNTVAQKIGLGLTLFMRDSNGLAVRVDPAHEFHSGDQVRVLLETNTDGFLYIFITTDNGEPKMLYPNLQLDEAGNYIGAHVPFEIPSSVAEGQVHWFNFDEVAGIERLYFVFTREPLAGVPIEDDLIKFCGEKKKGCFWRPSAELWAGLQKQMSTPSQVARVKNNSKAQTRVEHDAVTRGIGLAQDDPEPSLVMMNASSESGLLIAALELLHK